MNLFFTLHRWLDGNMWRAVNHGPVVGEEKRGESLSIQWKEVVFD